MGRLIGASHTAGGILAFNLTNMTSTPIVSAYMGNRLNSPNDLTVRSDGTIYFTDPDFQAPSPLPQAMTRVYRVPPGATEPIVVDATRSNPNGITLSLDEKFLFVTDGQGLWRYAVNTDGSTGTATHIAQSAIVRRRRRHGHRLRGQPLRGVATAGLHRRSRRARDVAGQLS